MDKSENLQDANTTTYNEMSKGAVFICMGVLNSFWVSLEKNLQPSDWLILQSLQR